MAVTIYDVSMMIIAIEIQFFLINLLTLKNINKPDWQIKNKKQSESPHHRLYAALPNANTDC